MLNEANNKILLNKVRHHSKRPRLVAFLEGWSMFIRNISMWNKKVSYLLLVFGIIVWLTTSFVSLSKCWSAQNDVQEINLSKQELKTLPCVWINGRTLLPTPPEPLNRLKIAMNLSPSKSIFQALQPNSFDPFYIDRIVSKDVLMNTMFPYPNKNAIPSYLQNNRIVDQFSEEEFLYSTTKAEANADETFSSYFRVNPYKKQSKFIYSLKEENSPKNPTYAGYLADTNQYCFVTGNRLLLFNPDNSEIVNEAYFPNLTSIFCSDNRNLFLYVDTDQQLKAYSIQKHAVIWQNANVKEDWYSQYPFYFKAVSYNGQFVLVTNSYEQKFISLTDGTKLTNFTFDLNQYEFPSPFQEVNHALWLQYYEKNEYAGYDYQLKFEKITYIKEKGFSVNLYQLDNSARDSQTGEYIDKLTPLCYSYIPNHNKVLIVFKNLEDQETQAIFELP